MKRRGAILDRDGTLIDVVRDAETGAIVTAFHPDQLRLLPGVAEGLRRLSAGGFALAIATNQPGAAKGQIPREAIDRTNAALVSLLRAEGVSIEAVAVCLHHPEGGPGGDASLVGPCACRKPAPGLLLGLVRDLELDAAATFMIGDSISDIQAGAAAGLRTALLFDPRRCELCPARDPAAACGAPPRPDLAAARLDELARVLAPA